MELCRIESGKGAEHENLFALSTCDANEEKKQEHNITTRTKITATTNNNIKKKKPTKCMKNKEERKYHQQQNPRSRQSGHTNFGQYHYKHSLKYKYFSKSNESL